MNWNFGITFRAQFVTYDFERKAEKISPFGHSLRSPLAALSRVCSPAIPRDCGTLECLTNGPLRGVKYPGYKSNNRMESGYEEWVSANQ